MIRYDLSHIDILVVDNNRHMLLLLRDVLNALGVRRVRTETDPERAIKTLATQRIDLIITEWHLEPMTGPEFLARLRDPDQPGDWQVPILLLTGQRDLSSVQQARDCGVSEFLAKPVSARTLYERIAAIIEQPRPFVKARAYRGPDRRRRADAPYEGPERRKGRRGASQRAAREHAS